METIASSARSVLPLPVFSFQLSPSEGSILPPFSFKCIKCRPCLTCFFTPTLKGDSDSVFLGGWLLLLIRLDSALQLLCYNIHTFQSVISGRFWPVGLSVSWDCFGRHAGFWFYVSWFYFVTDTFLCLLRLCLR